MLTDDFWAAGRSNHAAPFVAYHSMGMRDLDLESGFAFDWPLVGEGEIQADEVPAGEVQAGRRFGASTWVRTTGWGAYGALTAWMVERGLTTCGDTIRRSFQAWPALPPLKPPLAHLEPPQPQRLDQARVVRHHD